LLLADGHQPQLYLVASLDWRTPDRVLVDRTYEGAASAPEWGISLPGARLGLERYALEPMLARHR